MGLLDNEDPVECTNDAVREHHMIKSHNDTTCNFVSHPLLMPHLLFADKDVVEFRQNNVSQILKLRTPHPVTEFHLAKSVSVLVTSSF